MLSATGQKRVFLGMHIVGVAMLAVGWYLFSAAPGYGSIQPEPNTGRVYEINNHGDKRYVTFADFNWIKGLEFGGFVLNGAAIWLRGRPDKRG